MPPIPLAVARLRVIVKEMTDSATMIYAEKGLAPFKKPLLISISVMLGVYALVYSPVQSRISARKMELEKWQVIEKYASEFESADRKIRQYRERLPLLKDKEEWLSGLMNSAARANGMSIDSLSTQAETESGDYLLVSREASLTTTYAQFGKWLADIERTPAFVRVSGVTITKIEEPARYVNVRVKLSTVYYKGGGAPARGTI